MKFKAEYTEDGALILKSFKFFQSYKYNQPEVMPAKYKGKEGRYAHYNYGYTGMAKVYSWWINPETGEYEEGDWLPNQEPNPDRAAERAAMKKANPKHPYAGYKGAGSEGSLITYDYKGKTNLYYWRQMYSAKHPDKAKKGTVAGEGYIKFDGAYVFDCDKDGNEI